METPFHFSIDVPFHNEWSSVERLRTAVLNCLMTVFGNYDGCQAIAMVAGELLENAIKYGRWTGPQSVFRLTVSGDRHNANVTVENPVDPDDSTVGELMETLKWLQGFATPEEAYRAKLLEVAHSPRTLTKSKLGLARVAFEGNCKLDAEVSGGIVRVAARVWF